MIGKTISHYKILEKLGEGGMGVVYKAEDTDLKRTVALKFLSPQSLGSEEEKSRFIREAQSAAALDHPSICTVHEIKRTESHTFIVMAYIDGDSLKKKLKGGPLEMREAVGLALQVADGLRGAHEKEIVHRDIKPANVMITPTGNAKIMDFGVAKMPGSAELTRTGTSIGTVAYMSPEQARGEKADVRSDVWSLGVVLYEMVSGARPFTGDYEPAVLYSILNAEPEPLASVPDGLRRIINKALAKPLEDRYQDIGEMLDDLSSLSHALESGTAKEPAGVGGGGSTRKYFWATALAIVVVAMTVLVTQILRRDEGDVAGERKGVTGVSSAPIVRMRQITFSEDLEEDPAFSPNGDRLAYCRKTDGFMHLFVKELDTGQETQITKGPQDDIQPAWTPDGGGVLFVRSNRPDGKMEPGDVFSSYSDGDVWIAELDSGRERRLIEAAYNPTYSPDGEHLAVDASWAGPRRIWVTDAFGRNPHQVSDDPSEEVKHIVPSWSPDGRRLVFQNVEKTKFDIKIVDVESRKTTWVTNDPYTDINPVWCGSGDEVFFSSYRGGGMNIWRIGVSADGEPQGPPVQLTTGPGQDVQLNTCPGEHSVAFSIVRMNADVWKLPVSPETGRPIGPPEAVITTTREDSRAAWSPDGRQLAFNSDRAGDMNIWVHSLELGSDRRLMDGPGGDYQANWSPDGARLCFFSSRSGNADIWTVDVNSGELTQLTTDYSLDFNPFYSPDGNHIAFQSDRFGRKELWVMNADGSGQRPLTEIGIGGHFMRWTLDGNEVIFSPPGAKPRQWSATLDGDAHAFADLNGGAHISFSPDQTIGMDVVGHKVIWATDLATGESEAVFEFEDPDVRIDYPVWSPDGKWLAFDRLKPQGGDIWVLENPQN